MPKILTHSYSELSSITAYYSWIVKPKINFLIPTTTKSSLSFLFFFGFSLNHTSKLFSFPSRGLGVARLRWLGCSGFCDLIFVGFDFLGFDGFWWVLISVIFYMVARLIGVAERWVWVDWFGGGVLICRLWEAMMVVLGDYICTFFLDVVGCNLLWLWWFGVW